MRDSEIIGLMEDHNRLKEFIKNYINTEGMGNFETLMKVRAMESVLFWIPGMGWLIRRKFKQLVKELGNGPK